MCELRSAELFWAASCIDCTQAEFSPEHDSMQLPLQLPQAQLTLVQCARRRRSKPHSPPATASSSPASANLQQRPAMAGRLSKLSTHLQTGGGGGGGTSLSASPTATGHGLAPWEQYTHPPTTPLDIRLGLTKAEDINHKLRWGFVSASAIGSDWIKSLQDVPGAEFQGIWARDHEAGKQYAEKHGINVAHATYSELCNDPEVDIIYIASKTFDHHWQALEAIKAGKSVLVEKPFMDTAAQAPLGAQNAAN
jgi:hypothetical protein